MKNLNDEILNKYIDGELDHKTVNEVNELLLRSEKYKTKLQLLQSVHDELKKIKEEETSLDFTSKVMSKIKKKVKTRAKDKYFILSISTIFILTSLAIIIYILNALIKNVSTNSSSINMWDDYINFITANLQLLRSFLSPNNISVIGSIFSFGIIIIGYIFFENLRTSKRRLSRQP